MLHIYPFCEKYGFDPAATDCFATQYQALTSHADAYAVFCQQLQTYNNDRTFDHIPVFEQLHALQEITGIHKYTIDMLYLICLLPSLAEQYQREGIKMQYFDSFVSNLKQAACGSKKTYGIWSTDIAIIAIDFFKLKLFSIGRLQYKRRKFLKDFVDHIQDSYYIDVHIPGGAPLTPELCAASYAEAADFFRKRYGMTDLVFGCHSWLLSPDLDAILPANSNILAFAHNYTILETRTDPTSSAVSFIFDVPNLPADIDTLPENTSLQKAIKKHLKAGKTIDTAFGIMVYE